MKVVMNVMVGEDESGWSRRWLTGAVERVDHPLR